MVPKLLEMLQPPETAEPSAVAAPGDLPVEPVSPTSPVSPVSRAVPGLEASSTELTLVGRADGWVYTDYTVYIYIFAGSSVLGMQVGGCCRISEA